MLVPVLASPLFTRFFSSSCASVCSYAYACVVRVVVVVVVVVVVARVNQPLRFTMRKTRCPLFRDKLFRQCDTSEFIFTESKGQINI